MEQVDMKALDTFAVKGAEIRFLPSSLWACDGTGRHSSLKNSWPKGRKSSNLFLPTKELMKELFYERGE